MNIRLGLGLFVVVAGTLSGAFACGGGDTGSNPGTGGSGGSTHVATGGHSSTSSGVPQGGSAGGNGGGGLGSSNGGNNANGGATSSSTANSSASAGPGPVCGDGTCNGSETQNTCCADCGCPSGSSCHGSSCTVDPVCGDGTCNGTETQATCCKDCGCAAGSSCTNGSCTVNPFCGDGTCNNGETQASCCHDCGCPSGDVCKNGACTCTQAAIEFKNNMIDQPQFCFATNTNYVQKSVGYLRINGGTLDYLPYGGFVTDTENLGTALSIQTQCCLLDTCGGTSTCQTPNGNYPCFCTSPITRSVTVNTCGTQEFAICP